MPNVAALVLLLGSLATGGVLLLAAGVGMADAELRLLIGLAGVGVLTVGIALVQLLRRDTRRLQSIADASSRLASGEVHVFVPVGRDDAVGRIAAALNLLGDRLREGNLLDQTERTLERAMVRESPNGLFVVDATGRIRRTNPALHRLVPVQRDPVGCHPSECFPLPELQEAVDEAARTRAPAERTAAVGAHDLLLRGLPLADGAGVLGMVLDVSSLRRAERARREFVANVSHELRTPVTAIVGYAEALLEDRERVPADLVPMVEAVNRNAERLGLLIEDVLQLSRIEAREADLPLEPEPVVPLVEEVAERFARRAEQKGVALVLGELAHVDALLNAEAFEHALNNLVDNAIKYTPAGGRIVVTVAREPDAVRVDVADTGPGIDPVHHDRIFERFYRVDPGRDRSIGGTGLGLALVKHICMASRGEVSLRSAPGEGTTFTLRFPLA